MNISLSRFLKKARNKLLGAQLREFKPYHDLFDGMKGLEIGGPSKIFTAKDYLPVYNHADRIDGVNFSANTVWEGSISEGSNFHYTNGKTGYQFICEGNDLQQIRDNEYDFILSSHNLEHFANPLKAVAEWKRVLKPGGTMLLVLPDRRYTFDQHRPVTAFSHLLEDYKMDMAETDMSHLDDILRLHDFSRDPLSGGAAKFHERALSNYENRCLHQHVFDEQLLEEIFSYFEIRTVFKTFARPFHIIIMGRKATQI